MRVIVLAYPHVSNFDDFDPLRLEPDVEVVFLPPGAAIPANAALVILPGSKSTIADLEALRESGWHVDIYAHVRRGGHVLGICGGYQMLGRSIQDPDGIEGKPGSVAGLNLLDVETRLTSEKLLLEVAGESGDAGVPFKGYEMHMGRTEGADCERPMLKLDDGRTDGAISANGQVAGCHVHGLFADDRQRSDWLQRIGADFLGGALRGRARSDARCAGRTRGAPRRLRRAARDRARVAHQIASNAIRATAAACMRHATR